MSMAKPASAEPKMGDSREQRVTPLELFFDLIFVFTLTQVTAFLADHLTWTGMCRARRSSRRCGGPGWDTHG